MKWASTILVACVLLAGCDYDGQPHRLYATDSTNTTRFSVVSYGMFRAGHDSNVREIVVVTDSRTGREYLGITGVGVTELYRQRTGKTTINREE